ASHSGCVSCVRPVTLPPPAPGQVSAGGSRVNFVQRRRTEMVSSVTTEGLDGLMNSGASRGGAVDEARGEQVRGEQIRYVDRREIFAQHAFFRGLASAAIDELVARSRIERCRRGKTIFRRASPGTAMMAVLRGSVKICTVSRGGKEAVLNVIAPGQVFGEIAVLDGGPRTADAVA